MQRKVAIAVALLAGAAAFSFEGGNAFVANEVGRFDPTKNFFCDLLRPEHGDGRSNRLTSALMLSAVLVLVAGALLPLWWRVAGTTRWATALRLL